ncbi:MAG TPA: pirin family protein [Rhodanobacteraceae bacterium]
MEVVLDARRHDLGDGFEVGRALPQRARRMVGPFVFLDHMGPLEMAAPIPMSRDVRPHPHIGLSTVTYVLSGQMTHRDSLGCSQVIMPGALNWMTAGRGITHSERFDGMREHGGRIEGIQTWVGLPEENEFDDPAFDHYEASTLPTFAQDGVECRVIAGSAFGLTSPAKTFSPLFYVHADMAAQARMALPEGHAERAAFVVSGEIEVDGQRYHADQLLVFSRGAAPTLLATQPSRVMLLGGESIGPRYLWWNFVASRRETIEAAAADWKAGRMPLPPADHDEFIPLPEMPRLAERP